MCNTRSNFNIVRTIILLLYFNLEIRLTLIIPKMKKKYYIEDIILEWHFTRHWGRYGVIVLFFLVHKSSLYAIIILKILYFHSILNTKRENCRDMKLNLLDFFFFIQINIIKYILYIHNIPQFLLTDPNDKLLKVLSRSVEIENVYIFFY